MNCSRGAAALITTLALLGAPLAAGAQPRQPHRIGFLGPGSAAASGEAMEAFRQGLRELGYVERQNIAIEWRFAEGRADRLPALARELVGLKVDVLVSPDGSAVRSLRTATTTIPIVMAGAESVVERGLVVSLARPGGNVTGLTAIVQELEAKRMELLKETLPRVSRVAVFRDVSAEPVRTQGPRFERWGLTFIPIEVRSPGDFERGFAVAAKEKAQAMSMLHSPLSYTHRARLAELAIKARLAWIAVDRQYAQSGCLMSYGTSLNDLIRQSATYVDKILKGADPAHLPVEQPTRFELVVNLKTARALGLTIPESVLIRADDVIR